MDWNVQPIILTLDQTAKILNRPYRTVLQLCHTPGFPARRLGRRWMVSRDGLRRWVEKYFVTE